MRAMISKGATGEPRDHNLKVSLDILELKIKSEKKVLSSFY